MKWSTQVICGIFLCGISAAGQIVAMSGSDNAGFSEIILPFPGERPFNYEWLKTENTLVLHFPKSSPSELDAINNYDEKLVRRVLVKDLGPEGSDVRLVLRDRNVRAVVTSFKDPFRVSINLFDKNYSETKDPESGLPVTTLGGVGSGESNQAGELLQPSSNEGLAGKTSAQTAENSHGKRRLLQALPEEVNSPNDLKVALSKIEPGIGKAWSSYPPYIYRMQLAPYEGREAPTGELSPLQIKAVSTSSAMADYAAKLFDFGHEGRALMAYQHVLQREPGVFERDALHLWKFAETHLGQGNLTLAQGYYQTLIEKHPDHIMARFARLRKIDIQALKAIESDDREKIARLSKEMSAIPTRDNAELQAMIAIRNTWWADSKLDQKSRDRLPACGEEAELTLSKLAPRIESPKTAYLASAIIAHRMTNDDTPWQNNYAKWLANFFNRYKGSPMAADRGQLTDAAKARITKQFSDLFGAGKLADVVALYEQLPSEMKSIAKDPTTAWQIAESYRSLAQQDRAITHYATAAKANGSLDRFKASFWLASTATKRIGELKTSSGDQSRIRALEADTKHADVTMSDIWNKLKGDEKAIVITALGSAMQDLVGSDAKLRTPPRIILERYKTALTTNPPNMTGANGTGGPSWTGNFSPSASTVRLLDDLGRKFAELGLTSERRQAIELMKFLKPSQFEQDKEASKLWASELTNLAEEHRKADEFLEAGELYTLVGDSTALTETRAESLYKGGLLLFRAGKKQDAIKALEKAKGDTTNLFYSKLATERLNQIETK
ncbi:MAG: tetratricopeptide repeat protein [Pseudomonadota bacterium]